MAFTEITNANFTAEVTNYAGFVVLLYMDRLADINAPDFAQEASAGLVALHYQQYGVSDIKFGRCDAKVERTLADAQRIVELPSTVLYDSGNEVDREKGLIGPENIKAWIEKFR